MQRINTALARRVVARGDDDAVGPPGVVRGAAAVVGEDRVGDRGGGGVAVQRVHLRGDVVAGQHLERRVEGGAGEGVGVAADEQRPPDPLGGAVLDDGLGGRGDVVFVESRFQ